MAYVKDLAILKPDETAAPRILKDFEIRFMENQGVQYYKGFTDSEMFIVCKTEDGIDKLVPVSDVELEEDGVYLIGKLSGSAALVKGADLKGDIGERMTEVFEKHIGKIKLLIKYPRLGKLVLKLFIWWGKFKNRK